MALRWLAGECMDGATCPGVWEDDEEDHEHTVVVGELLDPSPVPLGPSERAIRLPRSVLLAAYREMR